jgi:transcriptional regulator with XRE-family HTH domain
MILIIVVMRKAQDEQVLKAAAAEIKSRRASIHINQEELAHRADVHRSFVARVEVAETQPSLAVLLRLADALEVDASELVKGITERLKRERSHAAEA